MRRKSVIDIKAALKLIVAENLNALRVLLRNIVNRLSKSADVQKKA